MTGRQKLFFLLERIEDEKNVTPLGQPIRIHPVRNLKNKYYQEDILGLLTKLEKEEKVIKITEMPNPEEGYLTNENGYYVFELLPSFEKYYATIQYEPAYQDFTGKKLVNSLTKSSSNTLMTYEEKLNLVVKAIVEAKKATRKDQPTTLYLNATNGLDRLDREEIRNILLQFQDLTAIKVNPKTNRFLPLSQQPTNPNYFLIDILAFFDEWYGNYLLKQETSPSEMTYLNLLRLFDTMMAVKEKIQINRESVVIIPFFPTRIYFNELLPYDTPAIRDEYIEGRWEAVKYLQKEGVLSEFKHIDSMMHRWDDSIKITVNLSLFYEFYEKVRQELNKRMEKGKKEQLKTTIIEKSNVKEAVKVTYNAQKGELDIEGKKVKLNKDSFRAKLLELLLKDGKSRKKEWSWDEVIEAIEDTKGKEATKENKNKFYPACDGLTKHIASKTGVNDLLTFTKSTVQLNSKYL